MGAQLSIPRKETFEELYPRLSEGLELFYGIKDLQQFKSFGKCNSKRFKVNCSKKNSTFISLDRHCQLQYGFLERSERCCPCGKDIMNIEWITKDQKTWYGIGNECVDHFGGRIIYCWKCGDECKSYLTEMCMPCQQKLMFPTYYSQKESLDPVPQNMTIDQKLLDIQQKLTTIANVVVTSGRYKGKLVKEALFDGDYVDWLRENKVMTYLVNYWDKVVELQSMQKELIQQQKDEIEEQEFLQNTPMFC